MSNATLRSLTLVLVALVSCSDPPSDAIQEMSSGGRSPLIRSDSFDVLLPPAEQGARVSHVFKFVNAAPGPLLITKVVPSCSCLSAQVSRYALAPGEEGHLEVVLDTFGRNDLVATTVNIIGQLSSGAELFQQFRVCVPVGRLYSFYVDSVDPLASTVTLASSKLGNEPPIVTNIILDPIDGLTLGPATATTRRHQAGRAEVVTVHQLDASQRGPKKTVLVFRATLDGNAKVAKCVWRAAEEQSP